MHFGFTWGSLWDTLGSLRGTLGSLGAHFGILWAYFGVTLGHFQGSWGYLSLTKMTLDYFVSTLGQVLVYESPFSNNLHVSNGF